MLWWSSLALAHTASCYVMVILGWGWVGWGGAITFMSTCTHTSCYVMVIFSWTKQMRRTPFFSCPLWGRKSLTDGGKAWKIMFPKAFQDGCIMESTQKSTLNWKSLSWVTVGENLWDHWHLTDFSKNFARPSKQWRASEKKGTKCCVPKKTRTYVKKQSSFGDFQNPIFHVNMIKNDVSL